MNSAPLAPAISADRILEGLQNEVWNPETQTFEQRKPLVWGPDNDGGAWAMFGGRVLWREA